MKKTLFGTLALLSAATVCAQDCTSFFPVKEGVQMELTHYDAKDKMVGHNLTTVTKAWEDGGTFFWNEHVQGYNDKGKMDYETDAEMSCVGGEFHFSMKNMIPQQQTKGMEGMEMTMDGGDMTFPSSLSVGQTLPDASINVKAGASGMVIMNMEVHITNRKVEAKESVTTPAGTFDCYRMSQDISTKIMMATQSHSITWYAPGAGMVKQESYNDKGVLTSKEVLTKLVK